ncbi:MAG TPA: A24 family peptidase [Candidatus Nanoarchaeia archaeon]|nr:A24 family peptidase [Candidatus Nanoarchaeia archaeon]
MIEIIFLFALALIWIIFATVQDLRQREVANWLNFSLIIFALGFRFFYGVFSEDFGLFYQGVIGFGIFFAFGNLFYYSRMFAGGDAKLMIALGAILPVSKDLFVNVSGFFSFLMIFFISGIIYGGIWSLVLMIKNFGRFTKEFPKQFNKSKKIILIITFFALVFLILGFYSVFYFYLSLLCLIFPYLLIFAKTIEESCMVKRVNTKDLGEGDWLYKNLKIGKSIIKANWEGLSKEDISKIRKKLDKVEIKQGIPFVPVFLISFLIYAYGILLGSQSFSSLTSLFSFLTGF